MKINEKTGLSRAIGHVRQTLPIMASKLVFPKRSHHIFKQFIRVTKIAIFIMTFFLLQVSASTKAQVSIHVKQESLRMVLEKISKQSSYDLIYSVQDFKETKPVSINLDNASVEKAVEISLKGQPLKAKVEDKTILISRKVNIARQPAQEVKRDTTTRRSIFVRVLDQNGDPLEGASITRKKDSLKVITNDQGIGTLNTNEGDVLEITFVGFQNKFVVVRDNSMITTHLKMSTSDLDEIQIIAYGTTTRRFSTGNVTSVKAEDIEKQPIQNPLLALQGRVPGMVISQEGGHEHGPARVEIRGRNSINSSFTTDPLFIIDGVPITILEVGRSTDVASTASVLSRGLDQASMSPARGHNPLYNMNPLDIESIEVLKDADATAIYGSRGANGVVLITTKKGKPGKNRLDVNFSQGVSFVARQWDMLNTQEYLAMRREAFKNDGLIPAPSNLGQGYATALDLFSDTTRYTDWQDFIWGNTGKWSRTQATFSGGNEQTNFRLSGGYGRTRDVTTRSGANQNGSVSFNLNNQSLNKRFKAMLNGSYSFSGINIVNNSGGNTITALPPNAPAAFNQDGSPNFAEWEAYGISYPFESLFQPYESKTNTLRGNLKLQYKILQDLNASVNFGYSSNTSDQVRFYPMASVNPFGTQDQTGSATFGDNKVNNWIIEPQLDHTSNLFSGKAKLNMLLGGTLQSNVSSNMRVEGKGYTNDALLGSISNALTVVSTGNSGQYKYMGVFGRFGFRWEDRYVLNLSGRRDGSSRFGPGHQFGNFGALGAAWIMSSEPWMVEVLPAFVSFIKFRGSYGITGSDGVGDYQFMQRWGNSGLFRLAPYNGVASIRPLLHANPDMHWEVNRKTEGALDVAILNDRLSLSVSYYQNRSNNQLVTYPTPVYTGFRGVVANLPASVQNSGWEGSVGGYVVKKSKFSWRSDFNISANRNKLLAFPNIEMTPYADKYIVGMPLNMRFVLHLKGVNPNTGKYEYEDYNKDGVIEANGISALGLDDKYLRLSTVPDFSGGLNNQFSYKNVQLTVFFEFKKKLGPNYLGTAPGTKKNISRWSYDNRWQYPGQISEAPVLTTETEQTYSHFRHSDGLFADASYIRLKTTALSYRLPENVSKKVGMSSLALNLNAQNLFTFTNYPGIDPDVTSFGSMPPLRTITAGFTCSF